MLPVRIRCNRPMPLAPTKMQSAFMRSASRQSKLFGSCSLTIAEACKPAASSLFTALPCQRQRLGLFRELIFRKAGRHFANAGRSRDQFFRNRQHQGLSLARQPGSLQIIQRRFGALRSVIRNENFHPILVPHGFLSLSCRSDWLNKLLKKRSANVSLQSINAFLLSINLTSRLLVRPLYRDCGISLAVS